MSAVSDRPSAIETWVQRVKDHYNLAHRRAIPARSLLEKFQEPLQELITCVVYCLKHWNKARLSADRISEVEEVLGLPHSDKLETLIRECMPVVKEQLKRIQNYEPSIVGFDDLLSQYGLRAYKQEAWEGQVRTAIMTKITEHCLPVHSMITLDKHPFYDKDIPWAIDYMVFYRGFDNVIHPVMTLKTATMYRKSGLPAGTWLSRGLAQHIYLNHVLEKFRLAANGASFVIGTENYKKYHPKGRRSPGGPALIRVLETRSQ